MELSGLLWGFSYYPVRISYRCAVIRDIIYNNRTRPDFNIVSYLYIFNDTYMRAYIYVVANGRRSPFIGSDRNEMTYTAIFAYNRSSVYNNTDPMTDIKTFADICGRRDLNTVFSGHSTPLDFCKKSEWVGTTGKSHVKRVCKTMIIVEKNFQ